MLIAAAPVAAADINLSCSGGGSATKAIATQGFAFDSDGNTATATGTSLSSVGFADQVKVELPEGGEGRIRIPRVMLPPIRGGKDGWFTINDLVMTDKEIRGSVRINPTRSPKIRIDRITGNLNISGKVGTSNGDCQPFDPKTAERKF